MSRHGWLLVACLAQTACGAAVRPLDGAVVDADGNTRIADGNEPALEAAIFDAGTPSTVDVIAARDATFDIARPHDSGSADAARDTSLPVVDAASSCNLSGRWSYSIGDGNDAGVWLPTDLVERAGMVRGYFPTLGDTTGTHVGASVRLTDCCTGVVTAEVDPGCARMTGLYSRGASVRQFDAVRETTTDGG